LQPWEPLSSDLVTPCCDWCLARGLSTCSYLLIECFEPTVKIDLIETANMLLTPNLYHHDSFCIIKLVDYMNLDKAKLFTLNI